MLLPAHRVLRARPPQVHPPAEAEAARSVAVAAQVQPLLAAVAVSRVVERAPVRAKVAVLVRALVPVAARRAAERVAARRAKVEALASRCRARRSPQT